MHQRASGQNSRSRVAKQASQGQRELWKTQPWLFTMHLDQTIPLFLKLQLNKIQMQTLQTQKNPVSAVYSNVTARIDTGLPRREPSIQRTGRSQSGNLSARQVTNQQFIKKIQIEISILISIFQICHYACLLQQPANLQQSLPRRVS